jgi:hypothetical protein
VKPRALPFHQYGRSTTSWITALRSGVRWAVPASPSTVHAGGDHATVADVVGRLVKLRWLGPRTGALSMSLAAMLSVVGSASRSSAVNWSHERTISEPGGMPS